MDAGNAGRSSQPRDEGDPWKTLETTDSLYVYMSEDEGEFPGDPDGPSSWHTNSLELKVNRYYCAPDPNYLFLAEARRKYPGGEPSPRRLASLRDGLEDNGRVYRLKFHPDVKIPDLRSRTTLADGDELLDEVFRKGSNKTKAWWIIRKWMFIEKAPAVAVKAHGWEADEVYRLALNIDLVLELIEDDLLTVEEISVDLDVPEELFPSTEVVQEAEPPTPVDWLAALITGLGVLASIVTIAMAVYVLA